MTICPDWVFDDSPIDDPHGRGAAAVEFLRHLKHPRSALPGNAFQLDPPFERIVRRIYGPSDEFGQRLVRKVYMQVGKGSRKTSLAAALALLHTFGPFRVPDGQNYVVAADKRQARIAFNEAMAIIHAEPRIAAGVRPVDSDNILKHPTTRSFFEVLASGGAKTHGRTFEFCLIDELWAHPNGKTFDAMKENADKNDTSLMMVATTAGRGVEAPDYAEYEYAKRVQAGEVDAPWYLPIIFEASPDDDPFSEMTWGKVLPGLKYGYPSLKSLRNAAMSAKEKPAEKVSFEQFKLGIRQDNSLSGFVPMPLFDEGRQKEPISYDSLKGRKCWIAVDMSTKIDLTGVLACFPEDDGSFLIKCWGFVPQDTARRRSDEDGVDYVAWSKDEQEFMKLSPGYEIDAETVETFLRKLNDDFDVQEFSFDPAYSQGVRGPMDNDGLPVTIMRQGYVTQSPALAVLEGAIYSRRVKWDSPVLRWCMDNVKITTDPAGNRKMDKGRSRDRIDLAVCLWMAVARADAGDMGDSWWNSEEAEEAAKLFA